MEKVYRVSTNGVLIGEFESWEGERLWQGMSEFVGAVDVPESRLDEWGDMPDDDIKTLLEAAEKAGFIGGYDMDLVED